MSRFNAAYPDQIHDRDYVTGLLEMMVDVWQEKGFSARLVNVSYRSPVKHTIKAQELRLGFSYTETVNYSITIRELDVNLKFEVLRWTKGQKRPLVLLKKNFRKNGCPVEPDFWLDKAEAVIYPDKEHLSTLDNLN
jgi:hypothetical protein